MEIPPAVSILLPHFRSELGRCDCLFRFNFPEGRPDANFDTFTDALLTVFQVRTSTHAVLSKKVTQKP